MMTSTPSSRYTEKEWDDVRTAFSSSILADTSLSSLAQNLEGNGWPIAGADETPSSYIDLSFQEMRERLALAGQPPRVADHLIDILKETMAFDDPFGEMMTQEEEASVRENPLLKNLAKLRIPEDFPITLTALAPETLSFCRLENVTTLKEFAVMAQRMAQSIIVGGDFRSLLNALSNIDVKVLARHLPFRPGATGLHYIEGLAHAVRSQPVAVQLALRKQAGDILPQAERELAARVTNAQLGYARGALTEREAALRDYFGEECLLLQKQIAAGEEHRRLVLVLNDPTIEPVVADLLKATFGSASPIAPAGWMARFNRWRRK
ncbi:MAG TPA: hypothetical protein VL357_08825 [Rariglobus sp.]|jgi:hypothetical protein|nr:hypothetical protein [Rariglobus sp.]